MITFGEQIKNLRKSKHITQLELSQMIGVDFTYISKMENNKLIHSPSEQIIRKIAAVLGAVAEDLILIAGKVPENWQRVIIDNKTIQDIIRAALEGNYGTENNT